MVRFHHLTLSPCVIALCHYLTTHQSPFNQVEMEIVSIGEILVDILRPKANQPLSEPGEFLGPFPGGAPANFIYAVAKLGVSCGFIGAVGKDDFGDLLLRKLKQCGVDISRIKVLNDYTSGTALVAYYKDGSRRWVFHLTRSAAGQIYPEDLDSRWLSPVKFLHLMGSTLSLNENCRKACYRAVKIVKKSGGKVSFDPNFRPELITPRKIREISAPVMNSCDVILPSGEEAQFLTGEKNSIKACQQLLKQGPEIIALKEGKKGSTVFTRDGKNHIPSIKVKEIDPTGAGDCYDAGFVVGLLKGWDLEKVARFANICGALAVTRKGAMEGAPILKQVEKY